MAKEQVLTDYFTGIQCLRIDKTGRGDGPVKTFVKDPTISVLLLHGYVSHIYAARTNLTLALCSERENAGLNITCASRVFLLESVVHHGFEVQGNLSS